MCSNMYHSIVFSCLSINCVCIMLSSTKYVPCTSHISCKLVVSLNRQDHQTFSLESQVKLPIPYVYGGLQSNTQLTQPMYQTLHCPVDMYRTAPI